LDKFFIAQTGRGCGPPVQCREKAEVPAQHRYRRLRQNTAAPLREL